MNRPGASGARGERLIATALRPTFPLADRRTKQGKNDRGDIGGIAPGVVIEGKYAPKSYALSEWLKEADREAGCEAAFAGFCDLSVVWFKLKGIDDPMRWPVMMRGHYFIPLLECWTKHRPGTDAGMVWPPNVETQPRLF